MFSHNLYEALCQSQRTEATRPEPQDEAAMVAAIQLAMDAYQRLFTAQNTAE